MANVVQGITKIVGAGVKGAIRGGASSGGVMGAPFKVVNTGVGAVNSVNKIRKAYNRNQRLAMKKAVKANKALYKKKATNNGTSGAVGVAKPNIK